MATMALGLLTQAPTIIHGVVSLVHGIESIFGKGNGAAKKAAVLSVFQGGAGIEAAIAESAPGLKLPNFSGDALKALSNLIDDIVAFNNAMGIFQPAPK